MRLWQVELLGVLRAQLGGALLEVRIAELSSMGIAELSGGRWREGGRGGLMHRGTAKSFGWGTTVGGEGVSV